MDPENVAAGTNITVPDVTPANTGPTVTEVVLEPHPAAVKAADRMGLPTHGVMSPKDIGMGSPEEQMAEAERGMKPDRERNADGTYKPKEEKTAKEPVAAAAPPKVIKPVVAKAPEAAKPAEAPVVAKVKIGDVEKTAEEWQQEFDALKVRAEQFKAPEPKPVEQANPEQQAEEDKRFREQRLGFIKSTAAQFKLADFGLEKAGEMLDGYFAGTNPEGLAQFIGHLVAASDARSRETLFEKLNPVLDQFDQRLNPLFQHQRAIEQYRAENSFLTANPDIAQHPQGPAEFRALREEFHSTYDRIQRKIVEGTASKTEQGWALQYEDTKPEAFNNNIATQVRMKLAAALPIQAAPVIAATPIPAAPVAKPDAPKPFQGGDRPGGVGAAPKVESEQAKFLRGLDQRDNITSVI